MSKYLGEIVEKENNIIRTSLNKKITLDEYHSKLDFRKGDSVLFNKGKIIFLIPTTKQKVYDFYNSPLSGLSPIFVKIILKELEKIIIKTKFSPSMDKDKVLSSFINILTWKNYYYSLRGGEFHNIISKLAPRTECNQFLKTWLDNHLLRQFSLWGLDEEQLKLIVENFSIGNTGKLDIEDLIIILTNYPERFLYEDKIDPEKIKHLKELFEVEDIPESIKSIKRKLINCSDSYINCPEDISKVITKIGKFGLTLFDNGTKICNLFTYSIEERVYKVISTKIKKCKYNWKDLSFKPLSDTLDLSEDQKDGLKMVFINNISIITGGPGTGKTKLIHSIIKECKARSLKYHIAAFTGKAAGRVKELAAPEIIESSTIDLLVVQGPEHYSFDFLILEEASMITIKHMYRIFEKFNPLIYKIILVGDLNQIPPIEKGHFFSSCIYSKKIPYIKLDKNFRIDSEFGDDILINAQKIVDPHRSLNIPIDLDIESNNFNIIRGDINTLKSIIKSFKVSLLDEIVVLTPYNEDVSKINKIFQEYKYKNSKEEFIKDRYNTWYNKDKIMIIKNDNLKNLSNGDIGFISNILDEGIFEITLEKDNSTRQFDCSPSDKLKHSYCFTINKSQGSEYNYVILFLPNSKHNEFFLNLNMVYTAITRAKKKVWIVVEDPLTLISACNKEIKISKDTLRFKLESYFKDQEYIGNMIFRNELNDSEDYEFNYEDIDYDDF